MVADGADLRGVLADDDVSAVAAFPDREVIADEDDAFLDVVQELAVALLMVLFDGSDHAEFRGDLLEAFFIGDLGEAIVHVGPFVVLAFGRGEEVARGILDFAAFEVFEPELGVLLLVVGGLLEDRGDLLKAFFFGLGGEVGVFVARLGFAGEGFHQALFGFGSFEFHDSVFSPFRVCANYRKFRKQRQGEHIAMVFDSFQRMKKKKRALHNIALALR